MLSFVIIGFSIGTMTGFSDFDNLNNINFLLSISTFQKGSLPFPMISIPSDFLFFQEGFSGDVFFLNKAYCLDSESGIWAPIFSILIRLSLTNLYLDTALSFRYSTNFPFSFSQVPSVLFAVAPLPQLSSSILKWPLSANMMVRWRPS